MDSICETCKFTPSVQYTPISRNQFRSEFAVPDVTLIQMASIIEQEERHIEHCSSEISRVQGILTNLRNEKKALDKQVAQHRSYISPMRRVPHELWVEIFSMCISEQRYRAETESKKIKKGNTTDREWRMMFAIPFRLAGVCLCWRTIVSSTPAFWSTIFYNLHWKDRRLGLKHYLERSEGHDLSIFLCDVRRSIRRYDYETEWRIKHSGALAFQMLLDCMPRIRGLSAASSDFVTKNPLGSLATKPSLKSLEVSDAWTGENLLNVILNLPHLESLTIGNIYSPLEGQPTALTPHVMCSGLRHLAINNGSSLELLRSLEIPNLQSLHLYTLFNETSALNDTLLVLSKFAPKLQSFTLSNDEQILSGGKLMDLLQTLPNVVTFGFGGWYDTDDAAATTSASTSIRTLFSELIAKRPRLKSLSLSLVDVSVAEEIISALVELLEV
ncbi:hypothetical protein PM082_023004 [Marasmius tenuissimus]|nr:hypothetical protein PM082_023004 [Marasmius tenuissimus]